MSAALQVSDFTISFCLFWEDCDIEEQKHIRVELSDDNLG